MMGESAFEKLPEMVQNLMLDIQEAQGNPRNKDKFIKSIACNADTGGFNWLSSPECSFNERFWIDLLIYKDQTVLLDLPANKELYPIF